MKQILTISMIFLLVSCGSTQKKGKGIEIGGELYKVDESAAKVIAEEGNKEKIICTRTKTTGSHMKTRSCMSVAQRDAKRKKDKEKMRKMQGQQGRGVVGAVGEQ